MQLNLKNRTFQDLFNPAGLEQLDQDFIEFVKQRSPSTLLLLQHARQQLLKGKDYSDFIIEMAPLLEAFIIDVFGISADAHVLLARHHQLEPILKFKTDFVLKRVKRQLKQSPELADFSALHRALLSSLPSDSEDLELSVCEWGLSCLEDAEQHTQALDLLLSWCVQAISTEAGRAVTADWVCLKLPEKLNFTNLVEVEQVDFHDAQCLQSPLDKQRQREGFELTDQRMSPKAVASEIHYCVYCHEKEGDFCSKGFPVKKGKPELGLKQSPLNEPLTGCPLEEKISEMHWLKKQGFSIGALATVMIDNPMCPATGHRICNDCMKACIYQKQDPVNIPEIETRVLTDVLSLPWGVEIYDLLTRWNPLRQQQYCLQPYNGRKVLVMGMGPAGFTLAHHLLMSGFAVVGCDGLKLEPLEASLYQAPIYRYADLEESLATRINTGFGGVAEYGITSRWDKNFLKLIYISLMRKSHFQCYGSVRFGGAMTVNRAWELGFDHLAIAVGAGLPKELVIPNSLAPGMRQANDFLMALQLTGAGKAASLANLQVRLPAVIIGGGLTGIDAATEVQAYYLVQIEKVHYRYHELVLKQGEETIRSQFSEAELEVIDEYLAHAKQWLKEKETAQLERRPANVIAFIRRWGGVTVIYRRSMQESPAYRRNHEELGKALEEGLLYAEGLSPNKVILDAHGYVKALECEVRFQNEDGLWMQSDQIRAIAARCILVATGAKPNVAYEFEHRGTFSRKAFEYDRFDWVDSMLKQNHENDHVKIPKVGAFTSYDDGKHAVSLLGDTHSVFHGSVVNAIASAKRIYPDILQVVKERIGLAELPEEQEYQQFRDKITDQFMAHIVEKKNYASGWAELVVRAPLVAKQFQPGYFYRLQTYESHVGQLGNTSLHSEAIALMAIPVKGQPDQLRFIFSTQGVSGQLLAKRAIGERLSVMGPTGNAVKLPEKETVMVIGSMLAAIQLLAFAPAIKSRGNRLVFVATDLDFNDCYCLHELQQYCDSIVWCQSSNINSSNLRDADWSSELDVIDAVMQAPRSVQSLLKNTAQVMVVGKASLIKTVQQARQAQWQNYFKTLPQFVAAVHGPMQCMLKGVCAQCLQWQIDPVTGKRTKAVYACSWHNQPLEMVDSGNLEERLQQNASQEKLSRLWLEHLETLVLSDGSR